MAIGWKQVGDKWYYLDPNDNGAMYTYWLDIGKDRYYLDENGVLQTGLFYLSDSTSVQVRLSGGRQRRADPQQDRGAGGPHRAV